MELVDTTLERIRAAATLDDLEAIRVDVLGRKGRLAQLGKQLGTIPPAERAEFGKSLNGAKQTLEPAFETKKAELDSIALDRRLDSEWLDLTLPAPGPRRGSLHPVTQIQSEIEDLFTSLGFAVLDGPEVETEHHNFDALNIPARSSRARRPGHLLAHRRQPAPHPHLARAGARHGASRRAAARDRSRPRLPQ